MTAIKPRTAEVVIYQGDYLDRIRHLEQRHKAALEAEKGTTRLLSESLLSDDLATEHASLVAEAERSAIRVTLTALGRRVWRELVGKHPAREGNETDKAIGVNEDTFKDALVAASTTLNDDDLDAISDIDFDRLYYSAFALNRAPASDPKALPPVSQPSTENDAT